MRALRVILVAAALAAVAAPVAATAKPSIPPVPKPPIYTFCTVYLQPWPIFTDDVPVTPVRPALAC